MIVCARLALPGARQLFGDLRETQSPAFQCNGAPLRLRLERQLGYKHAKYVMRVEVAENIGHIGGGEGGFWEDRGYEWYAGI